MKVTRILDSGESQIKSIQKALDKADFIGREIQLKLLIRLSVIFSRLKKIIMINLNQQFKFY
jgi:hypothetical protein